jgi:hypothetical protein
MSEGPIARRVLDAMRRQVHSKVTNLAAFREGNAYAQALQNSVIAPDALRDTHPAHAIYAYAQNQMSVIGEQLLELKEMNPLAKLIGAAQEEYMPSWPPMSPVTTSFFWCWANFDAAVNARRETLGTVTLAVAVEFDVHPNMLTLMRTLSDSRMSVYRVEGHRGISVQLSDLVTGLRCSAVCASGYTSSVGELWYTRVLPPRLPGKSEHVVFTSPYVLIAPEAKQWIEYFDRIAAKHPDRPRIEAIERHLKWGTNARYWTEFVFEGYVNHRPGAIFLKGLPDIAQSRPHSREYERHAHGQ